MQEILLQLADSGNRKGKFATFHMLGEMQLWSHQMDQEETDLIWEIFKECCSLRFGPPLHSKPLSELVNLKQTIMVEYQHQLQVLSARARIVEWTNKSTCLLQD